MFDGTDARLGDTTIHYTVKSQFIPPQLHMAYRPIRPSSLVHELSDL
jgi:hypothetical protein